MFSQNDLTNISRWFYENQLRVNSETCAIRAWRRHNVITSRYCRLQINNNVHDQIKTVSHQGYTVGQYLQLDGQPQHIGPKGIPQFGHP